MRSSFVVVCLIVGARCNPCTRSEVIKNKHGHRTAVRKHFSSSNKEWCDPTNHWSGLEAKRSYELEVSILERLDDASLIPANCPRKHSYFPKLLERDDKTLTFVQTFAGDTLTLRHDNFNDASAPLNPALCNLDRHEVENFARCVTAALHKASVVHLDANFFDQAIKNTVIQGESGALALIDFDFAQIHGFPKTPQLMHRAEYLAKHPDNYVKLLAQIYDKACRGRHLAANRTSV